MSREKLISQLIDAIRASQRATDLVDETAANYLGINRTDARALDVIEQYGPITAGRLAEELRLSTGAVTTLVDRLERAGYARRLRDPDDRRRVLVEAAPELRDLAAKVYGTPAEAAQALDVYSDEELELLIRFLRGSVAWNEERLERMAALDVEKS
jgi:DNA-binding MarR family transcriptional regulator